jgi:hypothetical protein
MRLPIAFLYRFFLVRGILLCRGGYLVENVIGVTLVNGSTVRLCPQYQT